MKNIVLALSLFCFSASLLQGQETPTILSLTTVKTELGEAAVQIGMEYLTNLDNLLPGVFIAEENYLFTMSPEFKINTGNQDVFSSITAKAQGLFIFFSRIDVPEGGETVNTTIPFHAVSISGGIESDNTFSNINGILEVGYVPWYQLQPVEMPRFLKHTKLGIFVQSGYKFKVDNRNTPAQGGDKDESLENPNDPIFRAKGRFGIDTKSLMVHRNTGFGVGLIGTADAWYDVLNSAIYYRIEGKLRVYLNAEKYFDFKYEKGSGAPNFNQGDQYGVGLTVAF